MHTCNTGLLPQNMLHVHATYCTVCKVGGTSDRSFTCHLLHMCMKFRLGRSTFLANRSLTTAAMYTSYCEHSHFRGH